MAVLSMSKQEFSRLDVLLRVQSGRLRIADACELIGLHRRQVFRLLRGLEQDGALSLLSKRRGSPAITVFRLKFVPWRCRLCASGMRISGRASRRKSWRNGTAVRFRVRRYGAG